MSESKLIDLYSVDGYAFHEFSLHSYPWQFIEKPALESVLKSLLVTDSQVLDAGCGSGRIIQAIHDIGVPYENIVGVDSSDTLLTIARNLYPKVKLLHEDISEPTEKLGMFDVITCVHVFAHLGPIEFVRTFRNFHKHLNRGGSLVYLVGHPFRYVPLEEYFDCRWRKQKTPWGSNVDHYHRTIENYVDTTLQTDFILSTLKEPRVSEDGATDTEKYAEYSLKPSRLLIVAVKK